LEIPGLAESTVQLPLSLRYKDIYAAYQSLQSSDSSSYELTCGFLLEVPVLGRTRLPVSHRGRLPLMRFPTIKINTLKLNRVSFSGADLDLSVFVDNPNPVGLLVNNFNYHFFINGQQWARGALTQQTAIKKRERSIITIPITLNFSQMGQTLYQIIIGNQSLNYHFSGSLDLGSSLPTMLQSNLPFDGSGQLRILK
jgi:LEA14-like dessication related protein